MDAIAKISQVYFLLGISFLSRGFCQNSTSLMVRFRIQEEVDKGTVVGRISDVPGWTEYLNEEYRLIQEPNSFPVQVGLHDGSITTTGRLNREELCVRHGHCLLAFNILATKALSLVHVEIEVLDINDNEPKFPKPELDIEISESASLRTRIPLDRAWDPDSGSNTVKAYTLSPNEHFILDVTSSSDGIKHPELVVVKELDREKQSSFNLYVAALDGGHPQKSGTMQVRINVLDSNDNSPTFGESSVILEVSEDTSPGTILLNLTATDPDQGPNGEIEFSFSKHNPHHVLSMFSIDPKLGGIVLKLPLDHETRRSYELDVQAKDLGPNPIPTHCKVLIKVLDINDNAPDLQVTWASQDSQEIVVSEAVPVGSFVALVMANDPDADANGKVHCHLLQDHGHFRLQKANGNSYILVTNAVLDREKCEEYNLTIQAQDQGVPPFTAKKSLIIRVSDANDNPPVFEKNNYEVSLIENNPPLTHLLTVYAQDSDLDANSEVTYSIIDSPISGTLISKLVSIHSRTGEIFVLQTLDYEEMSEIQFLIQAEDNGNPKLSSNTSVRVFLRDQNDNNPIIVQPPLKKGHASITVLVNAETGYLLTTMDITHSKDLGFQMSDSNILGNPEILTGLSHLNIHQILQVVATDADSDQNAKLHYHLLDYHKGLFAMDINLGHIYVNASNASYLIGSSMDLEVIVKDSGTPPLETKAHLHIMFSSHLDHLKNSATGSSGRLSLSMVIVICLAVLLAVCLLVLGLIVSFCRVDRKDNRAYNCREEESAYKHHPRRPQRQIQKGDIHVVPLLRGRQQVETPPEGTLPFVVSNECKEIPEENFHKNPFHLTPTLYRTLRNQHNHEDLNEDTQDFEQSFTLPPSVCRTLQYQRQRSCSRENLHDFHNTLPAPSKTLKNPGSPQVGLIGDAVSSEPVFYNDGDFSPATSPTLRRMKNAQESSREQILRSLVRLSMVALAEKEAVELTLQSPHVQQISQLLTLLHKGQVHPKTLHRGNKYSSKTIRSTGPETDWHSTKDSGHGESEAGDLDSEPGADLPASHQLLEDSLETLLKPCGGHEGHLLSDLEPGWISRLSLPLANSYKDNIFTPNSQVAQQPPITEADKEELRTFLTFGKASDGSQGNRLASTFLSEMSSLFEMLLNQKAESHGDTASEVLMRLSACSKTLGMDGSKDYTKN
ncbi:protocadherin-12 [Spea bombifrons]|uniref:protocadherin-12 n=1 Tax=Spea bombifrons TaxID=233779 RepID=UPI00234C0135|nr:protocadherin-12 [Spea bombifrons]